MIMEQTLASWAEKHAVKARGQAGFGKGYRATDNTFVLRTLLEQQRQTRLKGNVPGKL